VFQVVTIGGIVVGYVWGRRRISADGLQPGIHDRCVRRDR
jgi:hypothetical protein